MLNKTISKKARITPKNNPKNLSNPLSLLVLIFPTTLDVVYIHTIKNITKIANEVATPAIIPFSIYFFTNGTQTGTL